MSNLSRYDPFSLEPVADLFQGFFRPMRGLTLEGETPLSEVKIDVSESDTAYTVKAELPGVDKKDIDVNIDGNMVSISAKAERDKESKNGERVIRRERYSGMISRSFSLAFDVDEAKSVAKYENGILELTLPKKTTTSSKRLPIG